MSRGEGVPAEIVAVETSVWIDYFGGRITPQTAWLRLHLDTAFVVVLDLILCEVLQGIRDPRRHAIVLEQLSRLTIFETGGQALAIRSADNYRFLRARGITIRSTIDCLIATYCLHEGFALLHNDRDFDAFEQHLGLEVIHPEPLPVH